MVRKGDNRRPRLGTFVRRIRRDHGLPFSTYFCKVNRRSQVPVRAILLASAFQVAPRATHFGTVSGFNTLVVIATVGFYKFHLHSHYCSARSGLVPKHGSLPRNAALRTPPRGHLRPQSNPFWTISSPKGFWSGWISLAFCSCTSARSHSTPRPSVR